MKKNLVTLFTAAVLFIGGIIGTFVVANANPSFCNLKFNISDDTTVEEGYPGYEISVVMTDRERKISAEYPLTYADSWGDSEGYTPYYTVTAPALYEVTFEGVEDGYKVVDSADPQKKITIKAVEGKEIECRWSIVESEKIEKKNPETGSDPGEMWENPKTMPEDAFGVDREEADKVFQEFLEAIAFTENDEDWNEDVFIIYDLFDTQYAKWYAKYVKGGSEEEFLQLSLYERFIWSETYLKFAWAINTDDFNSFFGSEKGLKSEITDYVINLIEDEQGYRKVEKAYLKLAKWQYDCVRKTGMPYNFINKRSYLEETSDNLIPNLDDEKTEDEELKEAAEELLEDSDESLESLKDAFEDEDEGETERILEEETDEEGEKDIWGGVINSAKKNIIPIVIMIILLIILIIVILKRRSLNIDDNRDSGSAVDSTQDE